MREWKWGGGKGWKSRVGDGEVEMREMGSRSPTRCGRNGEQGDAVVLGARCYVFAKLGEESTTVVSTTCDWQVVAVAASNGVFILRVNSWCNFRLVHIVVLYLPAQATLIYINIPLPR